MRIVDYYRPRNLADALQFGAEMSTGVIPYAGGTDIMTVYRSDSQVIDGEEFVLLDLQDLDELKGINVSNSIVRVGALMTHTEISRSPIITKHASFLAQACSLTGSLQTRNIGTIGGNVANASIAADSLSVLVAMDAKVQLAGSFGIKESLVSDYCNIRRSQPEHPFYRALIVSFEFSSFEHYYSKFIKIGRRKAMAISRINTAVAFKLEDDEIDDARIVIGCMSRHISRLKPVEEFINASTYSAVTIAEAAAMAKNSFEEELASRWSSRYKLPALKRLVQDALQQSVKGGLIHD